MVLQHFGLKHSPLGKEHTELWDDGFLARLNARSTWLLESPGVGLLTGEAGVGKTAALRQLTRALNPHRRIDIPMGFVQDLRSWRRRLRWR